MMKPLSLSLLGIQLLSLVTASLGSINVLHDAALVRSLSLVGLAPVGQSLHASSLDDSVEKNVGFGNTVLLAKKNATRLVVGAPLFGNGGAVFVYDNNGTEWVNATETPILGAIGDRIGNRMSLSADGSRLAVRFKTFVRIYDLNNLLDEPPRDIPGGGAAVTLSYDGSLVAVSAEGFNSFTGRVLLYAEQGNGEYEPLFSNGVPLSFVGAEALGRFGWASCFNEEGDRLAISAPYHGSGGKLNVGLVRVFEKVDSSTWIQMGQDEQLVGTQQNQGLGSSLDLSADGNYLVVGSPGSHAGGNQKGKVSVYHWDDNASSWEHMVEGDIPGSDDTDRFGRSVAISHDGSRIAASSYTYGDNQGHVMLLDRVGEGWEWSDEIQGDPEEYLGFGLQGMSMTSDGFHVATGAYRGVDENGITSGEVNVYEFLEETYYYFPPSSAPSLAPSSSFAPSLAPSTSAAPTNPSPYLHQTIDDISDEDTLSTGSSQFGFAIASNSDGTLLIIGAPKLVSNSSTDTTDGGIFIYQLVNESSWNLTWSLTGNEDEKLGNRLSLTSDGTRLAIRRHNPKAIELYNITDAGDAVLAGSIPLENRGDTVTLSPDGFSLAVSEEYYDRGRGLVSVYHDTVGDASSWTLKFSDKLNDTNPQTRYGWATSFSESGDLLAVSAPNYNDSGTKNGLVHIFALNRTTSAWTLQKTWTGSQDLEQMGFSLVFSGDGTTLVAGSPGHNGDGILRGQVSTFRLSNDEWKELGSVSGTHDTDRTGRNLALNYDGTRLAVTSLFHDALSGQVVVFDLLDNDTWQYVNEREGYVPGDRLGFGVNALAMTDSGTRLITASLASNGTDINVVRTFDVIDPDDVVYNPVDLPEVSINGCVCNEIRICQNNHVEPGSVIRLCLNTGTDTVTFVELHELSLVEQDASRLRYRAIHEGKSEFGTSVSLEESSAFIETPLMTFFSGDHDVSATGIAVVEYQGSDGRYVRRRVLTTFEEEFDVHVNVEKAEEPSPITSSAVPVVISVGAIVSSLVLVVFVGGL